VPYGAELLGILCKKRKKEKKGKGEKKIAYVEIISALGCELVTVPNDFHEIK